MLTANTQRQRISKSDRPTRRKTRTNRSNYQIVFTHRFFFHLFAAKFFLLLLFSLQPVCVCMCVCFDFNSLVQGPLFFYRVIFVNLCAVCFHFAHNSAKFRMVRHFMTNHDMPKTIQTSYFVDEGMAKEMPLKKLF